MKRIDISQLKNELLSFDKKMMIIGQPKGVGLTTEMLQFFCEKMFFEEDYSVLILVDSQKSKAEIVETIKSFLYSAYEYKTNFDYSSNVLRVYNNILSIINFKKSETTVVDEVKRGFKYKISYVDKDDDDDMINYYITEYLLLCSDQQIIATYDTDQSIFYIPDNDDYIEKIVVYSELSKKNILDLNKMGSYSYEYERLIKGHFNNENRI